MSRTVHHVPGRHRTGPPYWPEGSAGPCTRHSLGELPDVRQESQLRAAPAGTLERVVETLDHPPTRHRHRDLWEA
ncbi:hypothetical protein [Streptomyces sp. NPDC126514]|uniref:hypothetical protein n=1 Tax=Streptomyces sp. NPDC126514 TaxID=3155210 RepID=UPI00332C363D